MVDACMCLSQANGCLKSQPKLGPKNWSTEMVSINWIIKKQGDSV
jgi:hypothetical protein